MGATCVLPSGSSLTGRTVCLKHLTSKNTHKNTSYTLNALCNTLFGWNFYKYPDNLFPLWLKKGPARDDPE